MMFCLGNKIKFSVQILSTGQKVDNSYIMCCGMGAGHGTGDEDGDGSWTERFHFISVAYQAHH